MSKKTIIYITILVLVGASIFYLFETRRLAAKKYTLNGTIAVCATKTNAKTVVYQYSPNIENPTPQLFSSLGRSIPCEFKNGKIPTQNCRLFLSSLRGCHVIYRTNKDLNSLPSVFSAGAAEAISLLQDKIQ